jgi:hypothetical protein
MMGGIRHILTGPIKADSRWDIDQELEIEKDDDVAEQASGTDSSFAASPIRDPIPEKPGAQADYYAELVRASIAGGGKYGGRRISMRWLRMTLAGLEGRHVDVEEMWEAEAPEPPLPEVQPSSIRHRPYGVVSDNGVWGVKANVKLATGVLSITPHVAELKIDSQSMDVLGHSDTEIRKQSE